MDRRACIQGVTSFEAPRLTPELPLHLITKASPWWTKTPEELASEGIPEPFWGFAWAGGQALSRFLLDHPEVVSGRNVVDFGAGGGIVSLAARKAGAARIVATEIDEWAIDAYRLNLAGGQIVHENWIGRRLEPGTILLCGDVSYSAPLCAELMDWFESLDATRILVGDAGRGFLPKEKFRELGRYQTPADYDSDGRYFVTASVWEYGNPVSS